MESNNMSVVDNQPASAAVFNAAFVSKTTDNSIAANIELADADVTNGSTITQVQRELNSLNSFLGKVINTAKDLLPTWTSNTIGASNNSLFARADALTAAVGANSGIAQLDSSGKLTASQIPTGLGGGGGGALRIVEGANSPVKTFESEMEVYEFEPGQSQELFLAIRVPYSYTAGSPINLRILWTCASTSGNALINAVSTLIRSEIDAATILTNQRTTTNAAITMSSSNDLEPQKIVLDISSSIGEINAVAISAGDLIKIKIKESSSTVADVIKLIPDACEVTFS
jgi:hypothetical protein